MAADLSGRAALITGAASGIGRASALAFSAAGASVTLVDIDHAGLEKTAVDVHAVGGVAELNTADVTDLDAMAGVVNPGGTAPSAHLQGIDFAGKTGSAQTVSNMQKAKTLNGKSKYKDNAWFVGVTPRRNPELVVAVLFEGGEHGQFAARVAAEALGWQKQAHVAQLVEHVLGKDEVTGSIPVMGSSEPASTKASDEV